MTQKHALLQRGFRPFFLAAAIHGVVLVAVWYATVLYGVQWPVLGLVPMVWHAHEMVFGFIGAVIAGFILTAMNNWTGEPTARGGSLLVLVASWGMARVLPLLGGRELLAWAALFDLLFWCLLCLDLWQVIFRSRRWSQLAIWSKLLALALANGCFYLGHAWQDATLIHWGLYSGFYLELGLVLMMARRLIPMFTQRGVKLPEEPLNRPWLDKLSMLLFVVFFVLDVFTTQQAMAGVMALVLFVLHLWRFVAWQRKEVWGMPLLWVLHLAYAFIVLGFLLYALGVFTRVPLSLALHAFAYGGMGLMVLGMMSRISLGHTGRDVYHPPRLLPLILLSLAVGAMARVVLPLTPFGSYPLWLEIAMIAWIFAFAAYVVQYGPILFHARIDGKSG